MARVADNGSMKDEKRNREVANLLVPGSGQRPVSVWS